MWEHETKAVTRHMEGTEEKAHVGEARKRHLVTALEKDLPPAFFFLSEHESGLRAGCGQRVYKECSIVSVARMLQTCFTFYS